MCAVRHLRRDGWMASAALESTLERTRSSMLPTSDDRSGCQAPKLSRYRVFMETWTMNLPIQYSKRRSQAMDRAAICDGGEGIRRGCPHPTRATGRLPKRMGRDQPKFVATKEAASQSIFAELVGPIHAEYRFQIQNPPTKR